ncbi:hypothetical protein MPDQ_006313 [Monascus purpureus]|uniref:Sfi1 spindle body domain-containing protein n=1 Tax=Monascus purpureus TaxID=5098 RepID=A0A507QYS4_MONPU|nr:hypothetical protein MPDQ_006313 [Monascus purpureus]BDD64318.1 hypothetical protein MAP00_009146 [Monascus purpureus]
MPPIPSQRGVTSYESLHLSDEDIGFLYEIVTRAERNSEVERLPFRALFAAYDEVVAEHGVDPDEGQAYLRFLFKMGPKGLQGESLLDRFNNVLHEMGIIVELVDDDDDDHGDSSRIMSHKHHEDSAGVDDWRGRSVNHVNHVNREQVSRQEDTTQQIPRRRASFNSMYDVGEDITQRSFANRPSSRSSMSRLQVGKTEFPETKSHSKKGSARRSGSPDRTQLLAQFLEAGRLLMNRLHSLKQKNREPEGRLPNGHLSESDMERTKMERVIPSWKKHELNSSSGSEESEESSVSEGNDENEDLEKYEAPPELLYRPSISDLLRDASTFNMYRQRAISRRILTQWLKKAVQTRQSHQNMEVVAVNRDRNTLIRQAFDTWRSIYLGRRQEARTERFFKHLEERAARARDLYLMTKAFTHWAQIASDEVAKTSAARRHILGVKYFNAWREITAVNELKSQRFSLRRPFYSWRKKVDQIKAIEVEAVTVYEKNLLHSTYWQWFWTFCDRRAPQWYEWCLKRRSLIFWLRGFRTNRERIHEIDADNKRQLLGSALQNWSQKSEAIISAEREAESLWRQRLLRKTFDEWRVQSRLAPAASRVFNMVNGRILRTAYTQWVSRVQMLKQARELDRHRLLRNTWTTWNDLLRCQALNARIEERLKLETMYKWVLAERFRLMQRIRDRRVTREAFAKFMANTSGTYSQLLNRADVYEDRWNEELLRSKLACWRDRLAVQRQREYAAFEFYAGRLEEESLAVWGSKHQNAMKLEARARDARFYFLATRTFKQLYVKRVESAKRRRQDAYATVRRGIKIRIVSNALAKWEGKSVHVADMDQQALQFHRNKSLKIASKLVVRWRERTAKKVKLVHEADGYYFRQIAYNQLVRWVDRFSQIHNLEGHSDQLHLLRSLNNAGAQLRKLSLRIFQINTRIETADALRERNLKKNSRGILRYWLEKARTAIVSRGSPGPALDSTDPGIPDINGISQPIFPPPYLDESPFKFSELLSTSPSPGGRPLTTPNRLTSPSRRAARVRELAQISTTPSTPLYTPFAGRIFRSDTGPAKASSIRGRRTPRSLPPNSVRFVDEEPESPESPTEGRRSSSRRT